MRAREREREEERESQKIRESQRAAIRKTRCDSERGTSCEGEREVLREQSERGVESSIRSRLLCTLKDCPNSVSAGGHWLVLGSLDEKMIQSKWISKIASSGLMFLRPDFAQANFQHHLSLPSL